MSNSKKPQQSQSQGQRKPKTRPKTIADVISQQAPTTSAEYIIFSGFVEALPAGAIEQRIEFLEQDKKVYTGTYKRIVIAYLREQLAAASQQGQPDNNNNDNSGDDNLVNG